MNYVNHKKRNICNLSSLQEANQEEQAKQTMDDLKLKIDEMRHRMRANKKLSTDKFSERVNKVQSSLDDIKDEINMMLNTEKSSNSDKKRRKRSIVSESWNHILKKLKRLQVRTGSLMAEMEHASGDDDVDTTRIEDAAISNFLDENKEDTVADDTTGNEYHAML